MGRKRRHGHGRTECSVKKKKNNTAVGPGSREYIWVKLERGVWWPGFKDSEGHGTFFDEEDEVSIPLTSNNWVEWNDHEANTKADKSLEKLSGALKEKFQEDLRRIILEQSNNPPEKVKDSTSNFPPDSHSPTVVAETITDSTPCKVLPTEVVKAITDSHSPTVVTETITDSTPCKVLPTEVVKATTDSHSPTVVAETITDSTPCEVLPTEVVKATTDSHSPTVVAETITDSTPCKVLPTEVVKATTDSHSPAVVAETITDSTPCKVLPTEVVKATRDSHSPTVVAETITDSTPCKVLPTEVVKATTHSHSPTVVAETITDSTPCKVLPTEVVKATTDSHSSTVVAETITDSTPCKVLPTEVVKATTDSHSSTVVAETITDFAPCKVLPTEVVEDTKDCPPCETTARKENALIADMTSLETKKDPFTKRRVMQFESACESEVHMSKSIACRGILCSGLSYDQKKETWVIASENDVKYYREFNPCVTHVIVPTDPIGARITSRTVKFFFVMANHCWILDYKWIEDSREAGHLLPEEGYEIIGDTATGKIHHGPKTSRLTRKSLLKGYEIYCNEKTSQGIDKVTMEKLILECGGNLATSHADFLKKRLNQLIVTCVEEDDVTTEDVENYNEIYKKTGIITVCRDWIFDSLTLYSVQPLDAYKLNTQHNKSEDDDSDHDNETEFGFSDGEDEKDPDYEVSGSESEEEYVSDTSDMSEIYSIQSDFKSLKALCENKTQSRAGTCASTVTESVEVQASKNKNGIRIWDKMHYCLYCGKGFTNITKHYLGPHKQEMEVQRVLSLPLKSEKRKLCLMKLRNSGDFQHNIEVVKSGTGTLVTWTRKEEKTTAQDYLPCEDCLAFFLGKNLWRHRKICPLRKIDENHKRLKSQASLLLPSSVEVSEGLKNNVIGHMKTDEITMAVRNDSIIVRIGEKLYQKHGHLSHLYAHISQKMRELARFLLSVRREDQDINSLSEVLVPENFPVAVKATRNLCGYEENSNKYSNPSLALKIGHLLKKSSKVKKAMALISGDTLPGSTADAFLALCESEWSDEVSNSALQTLSSEQRNKRYILPLAEDITKIQSFLKEKSSSLTTGLENKFSKQSWDMLNQVTLASVVLFNRRRGGETERITLENYLHGKKKSTSPLQEIEESLSPVEKMLCATFERVEIRGKKGRTVPVLLTPSLLKNIDCLMKYREEAGVHKDNKYLFPRSSFESLNPIRSSDCLRRFAQDAGLAEPENLTSTQLRKHVATISQVLNLSKSDLENMANFLGHDIEIHRSFYRLPQQTLEVAKMGRLLTAFDNGCISKYSGKTLDQIPIEDFDLDDNSTQVNDEEQDQESDSEKVPDHHLIGSTLPIKKNVSHDNDGILSLKKGKIQRLSPEQTRTLRRIFKSNVALRQELKREDCLKAIERNPCLQMLKWKKVKNTVHNWITLEKRRTANLLKGT